MSLSSVPSTNIIARLGEGDPAMLLHSPQSGGELRHQLETFVHQQFADVYGADVREFMPELLGICQQGTLQASVGLRGGASDQLFLEHYLDQPVCQTLQRHTDLPVVREQLVEVGNLAALAPGAGRLLIIALTHFLAASGYTWVVFTGTPMLLNSFQRLTLSPIDLGPADPARLGEARNDWGSYYATQPRVMAGYIPEGLAQLQRRGTFERLRYQPSYLPDQQEVANDCA
ncbi:hypothetical protein LCGC14_0091510 [marine sediment metagenome]|uniref:Thermostable hemolysin n=1 Tax=marine sediment metagenome TaxID=412755 RepID=A0A0F9YH14_9ZZZZ|nr:thermostable hemolysin [Halopseudomonas sabulinigri]|tara:strand:+ start:650 stop:1339 length:690 start_codon:yes stop_codon:yes gene_type:complete